MKRLLAAAVAALAFPLSVTPAVGQETLLLLARHAEKVDDSANPDLTPRGLQRAESLADIAVELGVRAVYSTDFCRTAQTAQPTAARLGLPIVAQTISGSEDTLEHCSPPIASPVIYLDPRVDGIADLLSWILEEHAGQTVLIVGHSNTVPKMLARLGVGVFQMPDDQYDRLFMVTHDPARGARVVEQSYGEIYSAPDAGPQPGAEPDGEGVERLPGVDRAIEFHGGDR